MAAPHNKLNGWRQDYVRADNTSGVTGVMKWRDRWVATLQYKKVKYHLGLHPTKEEAIEARLAKERELFGGNL